MKKLLNSLVFSFLFFNCFAQYDCWEKVSKLNDSYLKIVKIQDGKYYSSASNIWGNSVNFYVYESEDLKNWDPTTIEFPSRFNIVFNKDSEGNLYAGTQNHGVFISRDTGGVWEQKVATCSGCGSLAFEEDKNGVIYIGTGGIQKGIHVSFDKGINWIYMYDFSNIVDIESSLGTEFVYFTDINNLLLRSDDGGYNLQVLNGYDFSSVTLFSKYIKGSMYVFTKNGNIYKLSEDEETSEFYSNIPITVNARPYFNDAVYLEDTWYVTIDSNGVYRSFDNGLTWDLINCNISGLVNYLFLDDYKVVATTTDGIYIIDECSGLINEQPQSDNFEVNGNARFSISTKLTPDTYQWQIYNGSTYDNLMESGQFSGVNSNELIVQNVNQDNQNQLFRCELGFSDCVSQSEAATLSVFEPNSTHVLSNISNISISPNPASNYLEVINKTENNPGYVIRDISGTAVKAGILNEKIVRIDISGIPVGVYMFCLPGYSDGATKFIKSN